METVRHEIRSASNRVQQLAEDDQDSMLPMTIPGVGYYSALLIKSEIGDVKRFPSAKQLCSYAGLAMLLLLLLYKTPEQSERKTNTLDYPL